MRAYDLEEITLTTPPLVREGVTSAWEGKAVQFVPGFIHRMKPVAMSRLAQRCSKRVESPGFEPGTLCMRSRCDTTTPQPRAGYPCPRPLTVHAKPSPFPVPAMRVAMFPIVIVV